MKTIKIFILLSITFFLSATVMAQNSNKNKAVPAKLVTLHNEIVNPEDDPIEIDPDADNDALMREVDFNVKVMVRLFSIADIKRIHVRIGTEPTKDDFATYSFDFDPEVRLEDGFSYDRSGKTIVLGVGTIKGMTPLYAEVVLENEKGKLSPPKHSNDF